MVMMGAGGNLILFLTALSCFLVSFQAEPVDMDMSSALLIVVDQSGKGDYKTIQEAIDVVPSGNTKLVFISVKPGVYREKIVVPADKPFITVSGSKTSETVISWDDSGEIFESPTFTVLASDFVGRYLTIQVHLLPLLFISFSIAVPLIFDASTNKVKSSEF